MQFYKHKYFEHVNRYNKHQHSSADNKCCVCGKAIKEHAYMANLRYLQQDICVGICTTQCFDIYQLIPTVIDDYLAYYGHIRTKKLPRNRYSNAV